MTKCFACKTELSATLPFHRSDRCPSCDADVRVCFNCVFYLKGAHWDCREHIPEQVFYKDRANFCDYFRRRTDSASSDNDDPETTEGNTPESSPRDAFDQLFGGS